MASIYTAALMEHNAHPDYKYQMDEPTCTHDGVNPSCGDELTLSLRLRGDRIEEAAFTGHGCAVSQAAADMMADLVTGETVGEARRLSGLYLDMIKGRPLLRGDPLEQLPARQRGKRQTIVGHMGQPGFGQRRLAGHRMPADPDVARVRRDHACDDAQQGGFASVFFFAQRHASGSERSPNAKRSMRDCIVVSTLSLNLPRNSKNSGEWRSVTDISMLSLAARPCNSSRAVDELDGSTPATMSLLAE